MRTLCLTLLATVLASLCWGQMKSELSLTRKGNQLMVDSSFMEAELKYLEALNIQDFDTASYNLALAQYRQGKWEESKSGWSSIEKSNDDKVIQSMSAFAQGMATLRSSEQTENGQADFEKIEESLEHFKQAMRYTPANEAARHNYRLLKALMQQQPPQQQNQNQDGEGDDSQDQNQQDKGENNDKGDQREQNEDGQGKDQQDQNQDGQNEQNKGEDEQNQSQDGQDDQSSGQDGDEKKDDKQEAQQAKEGQISKEQALRLLEALGKQEQETLEKIKAKKAKGKSKKNKKDW